MELIPVKERAYPPVTRILRRKADQTMERGEKGNAWMVYCLLD
ncbi:hypothetical protein T4A_6010 [Trichinella pseudospiralis]|uniref:Uncharacterized protein n=1 Tax=Trichinella pseudospiralis TaxID=6337 RepID=A0A0V1DMT3_TRIPS|nr:hypothetical protein T4A_6010 [Trichinella pseudospiralis]KRY62773.1 hypothetical protein T4D_5613 [Trichinella pseudospiralis]